MYKRALNSNEGLLITPKDIHLITGVEIEVAEKEHTYIRKILGHQSKDLLVTQYCNYNDLDRQEIISFLYPHREKKMG